MSMRHVIVVAAGIAAVGCSSLNHASAVQPSDSEQAVGEPVYQPMLVVGLPQLRRDEPGRKVLDAMTARNSPVADVLLSMFKDSDINLLVDESVQKANCTFDIKHATVEEAFESLLRSLDLGYEWDGSFLRIRGTMRETLFVDLIGGSSTGGGGGSGGSGGSGNSGNSDSGGGAANFWTEIQRVLPTIVGEGKALVNESASTIHVEASPGAVERLREYVDTTLRRRNAQVSLESRILEVRLDDEHNMGVNWGLLPGLFKSSRTGLAQGGAIVSQTAASGGTALNFGVLDGNQYSVFVDALEKQGQVRVLSSPRVSTMNNEPANIRVADQIPVISREVITDQGVARSEFSVSFVEAGVVVQVTPMIGEDGMITVRVNPEVTEQTGTVVTPDGLVTEPILSRRSVNNVVRVADGQAVVLGGLRKTRKDETLQGIPFLMDLPLLGQLFSSTVQKREETELMIVLVPRVLDAAWIEEEVRRGAHRLVTLRRPYRWNSIAIDSDPSEDYSGGMLQGRPFATSKPEARVQAPLSPVAPADQGKTISRQSLASRLLSRAQTAVEKSQLRQATVWIEQALQLEPRRMDALIAAGVLYERLGMHDRAREQLDRALEVAADNPIALTARGSIELGNGSPYSARRLFERAHATMKNAVSATNLGAALLLSSEVEAARKVLQEGVSPDCPPELLANLTYADLAMKDLPAARQHLQQALAAGADPRNPRINALVRMVESAKD